MKKNAFPLQESIRWRLAASYAGVALLAAALLGLILIMILTRFYAGLERRYLQQNAYSVSSTLALLEHQSGTQEDATRLLRNMAFLTDTQIRYLDENGQVLIDTGRPLEDIYVMIAKNGSYTTTMTSSSDSLTTIVLTDPDVSMQGETVVGNVEIEGDASAQPIQFSIVQANSLPGSFVISSGQNVVPGDHLVEANSIASLRSNQVYRQALSIAGGDTHFIELSNGPAYGREIIRNVAAGWGIAGSLAVLLAALAGWWYSRRLSSPILSLVQTTTQMAAGDLSARAQNDIPGEFGVLAGRFNEMAEQVEATVTLLKRFVAERWSLFNNRFEKTR